jgi:hypothetical protein
MTQETFAALGAVFSGLIVTGLLAIGIGALVVSLKEWLQEKRWSTKSMLETQRALMEANNKLAERLTAIEDELNAEFGGTCELIYDDEGVLSCSQCGRHVDMIIAGEDNFCSGCGRRIQKAVER